MEGTGQWGTSAWCPNSWDSQGGSTAVLSGVTQREGIVPRAAGLLAMLAEGWAASAIKASQSCSAS